MYCLRFIGLHVAMPRGRSSPLAMPVLFVLPFQLSVIARSVAAWQSKSSLALSFPYRHSKAGSGRNVIVTHRSKFNRAHSGYILIGVSEIMNLTLRLYTQPLISLFDSFFHIHSNAHMLYNLIGFGD